MYPLNRGHLAGVLRSEAIRDGMRQLVNTVPLCVGTAVHVLLCTFLFSSIYMHFCGCPFCDHGPDVSGKWADVIISSPSSSVRASPLVHHRCATKLCASRAACRLREPKRSLRSPAAPKLQLDAAAAALWRR